MKSFLTLTAFFEAATGIALMAIPATIVPFLLGIPFDDDRLHVLSGITGVALVALAFLCWSFKDAGKQAIPVVKALLFYNVSAGLLLLYGGLVLNLSGIGLWPAAIIHVILAIWSIATLKK
jgi:hypothetical protein